MNQALGEQYLAGNANCYGQACAIYEPSIASSASSSQISVFSDVDSVQSSIASSFSDDFRLSQEELHDRASAHTYHFQQQQAKALAERTQYECMYRARCGLAPSYAEVTSVPQEQRQHPRRSSLARSARPPPLVRQNERKVNFVDNLVDSATQMVEVIWPLSVVPCPVDSNVGKGVLPLRTYIEETLRRSRTSYSTLQVALYYLILIKPFVPGRDFTMEQHVDCPSSRALMCGRRMFLAALILASKYLQDRNYSAKAWSKMSGLKVHEINTNERTFLSKVDWKLHIPEPLFKKWTDVVLRYTPNMQPPATSTALPSTCGTWKSIIPILTPELDAIPSWDGPPHQEQLSSLTFGSSTPNTPQAQEPRSSSKYGGGRESTDATPTPTTVLPRFLEPRTDIVPPTPALARMGPLPTPIMTPSSVVSGTPAASVCGSRRPSMCSAMAFAQKMSMGRCSLDQYPMPCLATSAVSRRPSYDASSSGSSPESMVTDRSRSSRASSISSISTYSTSSSLAPGRACLARQATCRSAGLPIIGHDDKDKEGHALKPIIITDDAEMTSSPEMLDFTVNEKALHMPHKHSKHSVATIYSSVASTEKSRKRGRPRGGRRSNLQEEVRMLLEEELDSMMDLDREDAESTSTLDGRSEGHEYDVYSSHYLRSKRRCYATSNLPMSADASSYYH